MAEGEYIVSDGISQGRWWTTFRRQPNGSLRRVRSAALPERPTREEAEHDLACWLYDRAPMTREHRQRRARIAATRGWKAIEHAPMRPRREQVVREETGRRLLRQAWAELVAGAEEPMDPERRWYPLPVDMPRLARAVGATAKERDEVLRQYELLRTCRVCRRPWATAELPIWPAWDVCEDCHAE